ncbi:hypothetical protein [Thalassospira marina]|uniref:Uncharacterized protein n=1 Tax=Thalassospira marina TaxID=2048283 RepID=A0A2N3KXK9_9PROT|nr:hypothetical protein [Thalassospira marina]AUG53205.1 hypothetical protein CSC3H3_11150 [Thalassospira marina]PKR55226.1 hypothetical protein COO20_03315 [Thalassospira marina]
MSYVDHELSIDEMLADPIVRTLMAYDRITETDVRKTLAQVVTARETNHPRLSRRRQTQQPQSWAQQAAPMTAPKTAA